MIKESIIKIVNKEDLTYDEAKETMLEIMRGETSPTQNAAFLAALSTKSTKAETIDEISGCAYAMRSLATPVEHPGMEVLEIVGTGGDGAHSFNISTTAAMVVAAGGVKVAKHGNRAASSLSGTADCLEALGVNIQQDPELCRKMLEEAGFCFMFAQKYHSAMKYVGPIRKELGFRTVFNILGPLTNPAKPEMFLLGVYDEYLVEPVAKVLSSLGVKRGLVVFGQDHLDEISASAPTTICELRDGSTPSVPEETEATQQVVDNINAVRTKNGLSALKTIPAATDVANKIAALREKKLLNLISEDEYQTEWRKLYTIPVEGKKCNGYMSINTGVSCEEYMTKDYCQKKYDENDLQRIFGRIMRSSDLTYVAVANKKMSNGTFVFVVMAY